MARYRASRPLFIQPQGECLRAIAAEEEFTMADDASASLDWIALDAAAAAAIAREQERYSQLRGGSTALFFRQSSTGGRHWAGQCGASTKRRD